MRRILLAYQGIPAEDASRAYRRRWNIETGFEKLKGHGFNMESTRLFGGGKMERLLAVLSVALAWCYACGRWSVRVQGPIRLKRHGRPGESVFARGRHFLAGLFRGFVGELQRTTLVAFAVFRWALPPPLEK